MSTIGLWAPKGGAGTTVVAMAIANELARTGPVTLVDLAASPDLPAACGIGHEPDGLYGIAENLSLLPAGASGPMPESGVLDIGFHADDDHALILSRQADVRYMVIRGDYLALRRAVASQVTKTCAGVILLEEDGRSLGRAEVADVTGLPVIASCPVKPEIARAVDAGIFLARRPAPMMRLARTVVAHSLKVTV